MVHTWYWFVLKQFNSSVFPPSPYLNLRRLMWPSLLPHPQKKPFSFKATSLGRLWTSCTVITIIAPGLCMPIVFGLSFLEFNNIIADHSLHSCIHKRSGYNLINPVIPLPKPPPKPKLKEKLKAYCHYKADALKELINTFNSKWGSQLAAHETNKPFDKLKAVKGHICTLISEESFFSKTMTPSILAKRPKPGSKIVIWRL